MSNGMAMNMNKNNLVRTAMANNQNQFVILKCFVHDVSLNRSI